MAKTVLFERREAVHATIDWQKTIDLCCDVQCTCGEWFHHCTHGDGGSAQHVRCPHCLQVLRLAERVELFRHKDAANNNVPMPSTFVQWKGTSVTMTADCPCGAKIVCADRDFAYDIECPGCHTHYHTAWHITGTMLSDKESANVSPIHDVEPDED